MLEGLITAAFLIVILIWILDFLGLIELVEFFSAVARLVLGAVMLTFTLLAIVFEKLRRLLQKQDSLN